MDKCLYVFQVLKMTFGDWELFRMVIMSLRQMEHTSFMLCDETARSVRFTVESETTRKGTIHYTILLPFRLIRCHTFVRCRSRYAKQFNAFEFARGEGKGNNKNGSSTDGPPGPEQAIYHGETGITSLLNT